MTRTDLVLLGLAGVTALLIGTDVWPGVRGPESWRWGRRILESPGALVPITIVFLAQVFVAARIRRAWGSAPNRVRVPLLAASAGLVFAQMLLLTAAEPGGLSNVERRVRDPAFTSYHTIASDVDDPGSFLRRYHRVQDRFPVHGPSQPPGRVLFFWLVDRTFGEENGAAAAGFLLMAMGALGVFPLALIVGGKCAPRAVGDATLLYGTVPSILLFAPQTDHLLLLTGMTAAALAVEAMRYASRPYASLLVGLAGLSASIGLFASFTQLAALGAWGLALAGMLVLARRRGDPFPAGRHVARLAVLGLTGLAIVPALTAGIGMDWPAVFARCIEAAHRVQVLVHGRTYAGWVGWNLWDFALFLGPPLVLAWLLRVPAEVRAVRAGRGFAGGVPLEAPFATALVAALVVLDLSGRILGETGRIWMFLMPLAVAAVAVGGEERGARSVLPLAAAQLVCLLALRAFLNVPG